MKTVRKGRIQTLPFIVNYYYFFFRCRRHSDWRQPREPVSCGRVRQRRHAPRGVRVSHRQGTVRSCPKTVFSVLRIRIHMFLGLPDPLVGGMDPDPSITLLGEFECPTVKVLTQWGTTNLTFFKEN
jgi:hypothetical protein